MSVHSFSALRAQVEDAFKWRKRPHIITWDMSTDCDARQFYDLTYWRAVTWEIWQSEPDAVTELTPNAFVYFLPSIVLLSAAWPLEWLRVADLIIGELDRTPNPEFWDDWLQDRFLILSETECIALCEWLSFLGERSVYEQGALGRAFDTIALIVEARGRTSSHE